MNQTDPTSADQAAAPGGSGDLREGLKVLILVIMVAFLAFVAGGVATFMKVPSVTDFMQKISMVSIYLYKTSVEAEEFNPFWHPAHLPGPEDGNPVVRHDRQAAQQGLNLVFSNEAQGASLVDMDGNVVHRWTIGFGEIWPNPPQARSMAEEGPEYWADKIYWRRGHLYPNGDLLVIFESPYRTPYGLGMALIDKDSRVVWKLDENAHHDTAIGPNGEIFVLTQKVNETGYAGLPSLKPPFIDDMVALVGPDGTKIKEIPLIGALLESDYAPMLELLDASLLGDVMHANAVQYIDAATAARFPFAEPGQLLISMREMNVIAVLDPDSGRIVWAMTGMWRAQHEPQMLDNGRILLYDNQGNRGPGGITRVIEFDPVTGQVDWSYAGSKEEPLISSVYGSQQRLSSGNTVIVESNNGRAIEVTRDGRIVWEFRSPHRKRSGETNLVAIMPDLVRVDPARLDFLTR